MLNMCPGALRRLEAPGCIVEPTSLSIGRKAMWDTFRTIRYGLNAGAQVFQFDAGLHWPGEIAGVAMDSYHRWMEIVAGPSLAGLPTLAVMAGFAPDGLPGGLQLIGPDQRDFAVLQLAHAYEQTRPLWLSVLRPAAGVSGAVSSSAPEN